MRLNCSIIPLIMFFAGAPLLASGQNPETVVPNGAPITIDGQMTGEEWADAWSVDLHGGGKLHLKRDATKLYAGFTGNDPGWAHLYVLNNDTIRVFHASAALGTAEYQTASEQAWRSTRAFSWDLRDTGPAHEQQVARAKFFLSQGWAANTNLTGDGRVLEFTVDMSRVPPDARFAFVFATEAGDFGYWPHTLDDATLEKELVFGNTPEHLQFNPQTWAILAQKP